MTMNCLICDKNTKLTHKSEQIEIYKCLNCKTNYAKHKSSINKNPWSHQSLTKEFLEALKKRREQQSNEIIDGSPVDFHRSKVLDYSCGQCVMLSQLVVKDVNAIGCDYDLSQVTESGLKSRVFKIDSWEVPDKDNYKDIILLLDVIEHNKEVNNFLSKLQNVGYKNIVCKVPLREGLLYKVALLLSKFNINGPLYSLYQVGDSFPHVIYFSKVGLVKLFRKNGYDLVKSNNLVEVGSELPERMRFLADNKLFYFFAKAVGAVIAQFAILMPETAVFYFRKSK